MSELLRLNPKVLVCEAYHPDLTAMDIQLKFIEMAPVVVKPRNVEDEQPAVVLLQNQPNPFVDKTTIGLSWARTPKRTCVSSISPDV